MTRGLFGGTYIVHVVTHRLRHERFIRLFRHFGNSDIIHGSQNAYICLLLLCLYKDVGLHTEYRTPCEGVFWNSDDDNQLISSHSFDEIIEEENTKKLWRFYLISLSPKHQKTLSMKLLALLDEG